MSRKRQLLNRLRIMDGARDLLDCGPYSDLTVEALARHLHMSKSTLYKYYRDKDDLIVTLVAESCGETEAELADMSSLLDHGDPVDALTQLLSIYDGHARRMPTAVMQEQRKLPRHARQRLTDVRKTLESRITEVAERGVAQGRLRSGSVDLVRTVLVAGAAAAVSNDNVAASDLLPLFV